MHGAFLLIIIYVAFVSLGLPDSVLGVGWPTMRTDVQAPLEAAGVVAIVLTTCSAISAALSGSVNGRLGTGPVVLVSCALTALGLLGYSISPSLGWLLAAAIPLGFGQGAVDSSLNGFVASHYASRHMNWLHASWGIGATLGPLVMIRSMEEGLGWRTGYRSLALIQMALVLLFLVTLKAWKREPGGRQERDTLVPSGPLSGMRRSEPWIQIGMYALYAACEFSVGIWAASLLVESRHLSATTAGLWVAMYYGGITGGRFLTGLVADRWGNRALVRGGLVVAFVGAGLLAVRHPDWLAAPALLMLGLGFAPIYPCLMHETPRRFDAETTRTVIGFQVGAACVGAALLPTLLGVSAAATTLEILVPCVAVGIGVLIFCSERLNRVCGGRGVAFVRQRR